MPLSHDHRIQGTTNDVVPHTRRILITVFLMLLAAAASLLTPYLTKIVLDEVIPHKDFSKLAWLSAMEALTAPDSETKKTSFNS